MKMLALIRRHEAADVKTSEPNGGQGAAFIVYKRMFLEELKQVMNPLIQSKHSCGRLSGDVTLDE